MYRITLGKEYPTDSTLYLNEKEFSIESIGWKILEIFWDIRYQCMTEDAGRKDVQGMLKIVYENSDQFNI